MKAIGKVIIFSTVILAAGLGWAKEGVKNPIVKARMELMDSMGGSVKVLSEMAKGSMAFDADAATQAIAGLTGNANLITDRFEPQESDPVSAAKPDIWTDWAGFSDKAEGLFRTALSADVSSAEAIQAEIGKIGAACGGCHEVYRNKL